MSDAQKRKMSMRAAWMGRADLEKKAHKIISSTDCPLVCIFASTGGPSTETSMTCAYYEHNTKLLHYSPHCEALGSIGRCPLLRRAKDNRDFRSFMDIRLAQIHREHYIVIVEGAAAYRVFSDDEQRARDRAKIGL